MTERNSIDFDNLDLDSILSEVERRTPHLKVADVTFRNGMHLSKGDRDKLTSILGELSGDGEKDVEDIYRRALLLVADDEKAAEVLIDGLGGTLAGLVTLMDLYFERTQVGEVSPSRD